MWTVLCLIFEDSLVAHMVKNLPLPLNAGDLNLIHGWWRREWLPILAFFPGEFHEQRSLVGYSPRVAKSQTQVSN